MAGSAWMEGLVLIMSTSRVGRENEGSACRSQVLGPVVRSHSAWVGKIVSCDRDSPSSSRIRTPRARSLLDPRALAT